MKERQNVNTTYERTMTITGLGWIITVPQILLTVYNAFCCKLVVCSKLLCFVQEPSHHSGLLLDSLLGARLK